MPRSSIRALADQSSPLLKFEDEKAYLCPEGLELIRNINGPIYPIILMGDGRAGKSYLASRLLNVEEVFVTSDSAEPVTEGIDVVACPMSVLERGLLAEPEETKSVVSTFISEGPDDAEGQENALTTLLSPKLSERMKGKGSTKSLRVPTGKKQREMTALVLDCEGGNNAMAAIRTLVNVFGIIIGVEVLFVAGGSFSEASIQNLGASLAARSLIKVGEGGGLRGPKLVFVVNKNTLKYAPDTLDKSLFSKTKDQGRQDNRQIILDTFSDRDFHAIPLMEKADFEDHILALKKAIVADARPLFLSDVIVEGPQMATLLEMMTEQMATMNEVSLPSMSRYVIFDGFLRPMIEELAIEGAARMPDVTDYIADFDSMDPRPSVAAELEAASAHINEKHLIEEAKTNLVERLTSEWERRRQVNEAMGEQTKETKSETRETVVSEKEEQVRGNGMLSKVFLTMQTFRVETRTTIINKKGEEKIQDWNDTGTPVVKIKQTAFQDIKEKKVPFFFGKLAKQSPSFWRFGAMQPRMCVVKEGHMMWWDPDYTKMVNTTLQGSINFMINSAVVEPDPSNKNQFIVKPSSRTGKWAKPTTFSGGDARHMVFSCEGTGVSRDKWIDAVEKNISFAELAAVQLSAIEVSRQIGNSKPTLLQALYGASERTPH